LTFDILLSSRTSSDRISVYSAVNQSVIVAENRRKKVTNVV
jgi:hypothetical protein